MFCLGGFCPGGFWQGGFLSRGFLFGGLCPGGFCPGGFCPRTGPTDTWLQLLSTPVSCQIMLSSEKEFTAEKTLLQLYFGLASGLLFF